MTSIVGFLKYPLVVPNVTYLRKLIKRGIEPRDVRYSFRNDSIFLKSINCEVSSRKNFFLLEGIRLANDLVEQCGAKIWIDEDGQANVEIQGLEFYLNSWEELNILCEIFAQGIYNVQLDEPFIFIDIGMNVAMTTLFLAANQKVAEIYAYEPFAETFQSGLRNIERNPRFAAKIHAFNYGISTRAEELVVDYFTEFKGSVGMKGIPGRVLNDKLRQKIRKEKVSLRAVDEILSEISLKHPGRKLITKIDCEGSETEIVRLLNQKNLLAEFEVIMLEWHSSGPEELARILVENKFCCFSFDPFRKDIGMIYAVRGH